MEIEVPTVYAASRFDQKVTLAPASVSIVTSDEIRKYGFRTVADAVNSLPGVFLSDDRNYTYLGVRGFMRPGDYMSRILMLVDGHRMNDNIYDAFFLGTDGLLDVDLVDRIEFIPGPSSSIYGDNAFLGVIHIKTKRGAQINGVEASAEGGSLDTYRGRVTLGKEFKNGIEALFSASLFESGGDRSIYYPAFDDPATSNGIARNSDDERARQLFGSVSYHDFTLSGGMNWRDKTVPTGSFETIFNDGREKTRDFRGYLDLRFDRAITDDSRLLARVAYDHYQYDGVYPYEGPDEFSGPILNYDRAKGDWISAEAQYNHTLFDTHTVIAGFDYEEDLRKLQQNYDIEPKTYYLDDEHSGRHFGPFAEADVALMPTVHLNAGLRYDYYTSFGGTLNPRLALLYNPWEPTTFKLLYGRAFRSPNGFELYYLAPDGARSNPELQPETIDTYELVWEQKLGKHHRLRVSGYLYEIDGLISQTADPVTGETYYDNLDQVEAKGLELSWEGRFQEGIVARSSYSLQQSEDAVTGRELSNSPRHIGKFNLIVPVFRETLFAGLEVQYRGDTLTLQGNRVDDFFIANFTLFGLEIFKGLDASASVYNLFDTREGVPGGAEHRQDILPLTGRTFRLKLTYRF